MSSNQPARPAAPPTSSRNSRTRDAQPPAPVPPSTMPSPAMAPYYPQFPYQLDHSRLFVPTPAANQPRMGPDLSHVYRADQQFPTHNPFAPRQQQGSSQRPRTQTRSNWTWGTPQTGKR